MFKRTQKDHSKASSESKDSKTEKSSASAKPGPHAEKSASPQKPRPPGSARPPSSARPGPPKKDLVLSQRKRLHAKTNGSTHRYWSSWLTKKAETHGLAKRRWFVLEESVEVGRVRLIYFDRPGGAEKGEIKGTYDFEATFDLGFKLIPRTEIAPDGSQLYLSADRVFNLTADGADDFEMWRSIFNGTSVLHAGRQKVVEGEDDFNFHTTDTTVLDTPLSWTTVLDAANKTVTVRAQLTGTRTVHLYCSDRFEGDKRLATLDADRLTFVPLKVNIHRLSAKAAAVAAKKPSPAFGACVFELRPHPVERKVAKDSVMRLTAPNEQEYNNWLNELSAACFYVCVLFLADGGDGSSGDGEAGGGDILGRASSFSVATSSSSSKQSTSSSSSSLWARARGMTTKLKTSSSGLSSTATAASAASWEHFLMVVDVSNNTVKLYEEPKPVSSGTAPALIPLDPAMCLSRSDYSFSGNLDPELAADITFDLVPKKNESPTADAEAIFDLPGSDAEAAAASSSNHPSLRPKTMRVKCFTSAEFESLALSVSTVLESESDHAKERDGIDANDERDSLNSAGEGLGEGALRTSESSSTSGISRLKSAVSRLKKPGPMDAWQHNKPMEGVWLAAFLKQQIVAAVGHMGRIQGSGQPTAAASRSRNSIRNFDVKEDSFSIVLGAVLAKLPELTIEESMSLCLAGAVWACPGQATDGAGAGGDTADVCEQGHHFVEGRALPSLSLLSLSLPPPLLSYTLIFSRYIYRPRNLDHYCYQEGQVDNGLD